MRTRINIDGATPEEIKNLTSALQNVTYLDHFEDDDARHPRVWVHDGGMGWESPSISRQRAADVLREFDRLDAGLFDNGGSRIPAPLQRQFDMRPGDRPTGTNPAVEDEPLAVGTEVYYRGEPGWVVTDEPSGEPGSVVIAMGMRNTIAPLSVLEEVEQPTSPEPESVDPLAGDSEKIEVTYYHSADEPGEGSLFSVYSQVVVNGEDVGDPTRVGQGFETEEAAEAEANRLTSVSRELFPDKQ